MIGKKQPSRKKVRPRRPLAKVLQSVTQVMKISHVTEEESIWQWGEAALDALPSCIEVGVWNIWKGSGGAGFLNEYTRMLKERHLLLLQEALLTLKALGHFVPTGYAAHHGATYRRKDGIRDGVMTVSSARASENALRILCQRPEPVFNTTKATLVTNYKITGHKHTLCVVNTHSTLIRRPATAVRELEAVIDHLAGHEGPLLYAGDFNTFSNAYIKEVDRVLSTIGLRRVPLEGDPRTRTTALDQIYVRDIEVVRASVDTSYTHSDHFPIIATMKIT